jgi:hypothetical protein
MSRAQGLPLNLIILGIIAALVLSIVVAFTVGGTGSTFNKIGKTGAQIGGELESLQASCRTACDSSRLGLTATSQWGSSAYCVKKLNLDLNGNGLIDSGETGLGCWQSPISTSCTGQVQSAGNVFTVTEANCPGGTTVASPSGGSGAGGTTDTSPPGVSVAHEPANPLTTDSVRVSVSATDYDSHVTEIKAYIDGQLAVTCPTLQDITGGGCWTTATTYSAGDHTYYGTATNGVGLTGQSSIQTFTVTQQLQQATSTCGDGRCDFPETTISCIMDCGTRLTP